MDKVVYRQTSYRPVYKPNNWDVIRSYLRSFCPDIRKSICGGCGQGTIYDVNNKPYSISRNNTIDEVKKMVEEIRKTKNASI